LRISSFNVLKSEEIEKILFQIIDQD
jgi:hypothetical protein